MLFNLNLQFVQLPLVEQELAVALGRVVEVRAETVLRDVHLANKQLIPYEHTV